MCVTQTKSKKLLFHSVTLVQQVSRDVSSVAAVPVTFRRCIIIPVMCPTRIHKCIACNFTTQIIYI